MRLVSLGSGDEELVFYCKQEELENNLNLLK